MRVKVIIEFFEKFGGSNHSGISSISVSGVQSKLNSKWLEKFLGKLYESHRKSEFNFADFIFKLMENPSSTSLRTSIIQCLKDLREKQESGDNDNVGTLLKSLRVCYKCLGHHLHEASNIMYHAAMDESKNIRIEVRLEYLEYAEQDARQYQNGIVGRSRLSMNLEDNVVQHARIQLDTFKAAESAGCSNNIIDRLRDQILWSKKTDLQQLIYDLKCFSTWELLLRMESLNPVPNRNYCRNLWAAILHQECFRDVSKSDRDFHDNSLTTALASVGFGYLLNPQTLKNVVAPSVFVGLRSAVIQPALPNQPNQIYLKYAAHPKYLPETATGYGASRDMLLPNRLHKVIDDIIRKDGVRVTFDNRSILQWLVTILASEEYPTDWCTSAILKSDTHLYSQLQSLQRNCRSAKAFIMHLPQEIETSGITTKKQMAHILKDPNFYPFQTQPSAEWRMVWLYLLYNCDERLAAKKEFDDFQKDLNNLPQLSRKPSFQIYGASGNYNQPNTYVLKLMYDDATNW